MRNHSVVLLVISLAILALGAFNYKQAGNTPLAGVTNQYRANLTKLAGSIGQLRVKAATATTEKDIDSIKTIFLQVRAHYKQTEYLLEYFDNYSVKDYINGAPLPKIERNSPDMKVQEPHGLQVIEEILYAGDVLENITALREEINLLETSFAQVKQFQEKQPITERNLFEAARMQLVRIATMGITGFDVPGSGNSLTDAENSLLPLVNLAEAYNEQLSKPTADKLIATLSGAINYLKNNPDFDTFNRLVFIRDYLNPAYKLFKDAQTELGIETIYETVAGKKQPFNYLADNFFGQDFLNPDYFSIIAGKSNATQKAQLGKYLFFDPVLSANNKRACASCHNPQKAFTDGEQRSIAMDFNGTVARNAPTLINSVFADRYFYDLRTEKIENQFEHVITSPHEFNTSYIEITGKLTQSKEYTQLFAAAFPEYKGSITKESISEAIGAYLKTLVAFNSEFDKNIRGEANTLSPEAINGFNLFMGKAVCATCHFAPTFSGLVPPQFAENESEVLGIPTRPDTANAELDGDIGRFGGRMREKVEFNMYAFKTVTVRNIALTAPYMHNGVYTTLEQVVDFYNRGGGKGIGIHLENQTLPFDELNLTLKEQNDIVAFMKTLTDTTGLTAVPATLPAFDTHPDWNKRVVGGEY